ncbi:MAG: cysteine--tRNA ligase [Elusimicrobia bacterium]|nr:cysteine--tRNA ligase [Elusimicrobiota bacterium]
MDIFLTNTLSGQLEKFEPLNPGCLGLYVCGITPYDSPHLGHARCYVTFDIVRRTFEAAGLEVRHIQNFTDMDDKIIARAVEQNISPKELSERFIGEYFETLDALGVLRAHEYPRVTGHIPQIIEAVQGLIQNNHAYQAANGDVYFSVSRFKGYGKLSKRKTEELIAGARVEVSEHKKDPLDFALWKAEAKPDSSWDSPWGRGRPGWHIECSVMSTQYLGQPFDIHGGGLDLIFPHHENEIAQSEAWRGSAFCRYFMHNGFVTINKEKMSKSLGNFFTLKDIYKKFSPQSVRYYLLTEQYRRPIDFSDAALKEAEAALSRLNEAAELLLFVAQSKLPSSSSSPDKKFLYDQIFESLAQDFHTPGALAALQSWAGEVFDLFKKKKLEPGQAGVSLSDAVRAAKNLLGLEISADGPAHPAEAGELAAQRQSHRQAKEFQKADDLRREIETRFGLLVEDTPYGPRLRSL